MDTAATLITVKNQLHSAMLVIAEENANPDHGVSAESDRAHQRLRRAYRYLERRCLRLEALRAAKGYSLAADRSVSLTTSRQHLEVADHLRDQAALLRGVARNGDFGVVARMSAELGADAFFTCR